VTPDLATSSACLFRTSSSALLLEDEPAVKAIRSAAGYRDRSASRALLRRNRWRSSDATSLSPLTALAINVQSNPQY
jgi:hypothetical protein